jgi:ATP-dependent DNA helicase Q1
MVRFTQDYTTCRKIGFARYFLESSHIEIESWSTSNESVYDRCGHCDNCTRDTASVEAADVTSDAYKIIKAVQHISLNNVRMSMSALAAMVRGIGKKTAESSKSGRGQKVDVDIDIETLVKGKVKMSSDDTEQMICHLIIEKILGVYPVATAHTTNIYIKPGLHFHRIYRLPENGLDELTTRIKCNFLRKVKKGKSRAQTNKRKRTDVVDSEETSEAEEEQPRQRRRAKDVPIDSSEEEEAEAETTTTRRHTVRRRSGVKIPASRHKSSSSHSHPTSSTLDTDIIDLVSEADNDPVPGPSRSTTAVNSSRHPSDPDDDNDDEILVMPRPSRNNRRGLERKIQEEEEEIEDFDMEDAIVLDALPFRHGDGDSDEFEEDWESDGGVNTGFQFNLRGSKTKPP